MHSVDLKRGVEGLIKRIVLSAFFAFLAAVAITCLLGVLIQTEAVDLQMAFVLNRILSALVLFAVCYVAAKTAPQGRMQVALGTAAVYVICLAAVRLLLHPQTPWNVGWELGLYAGASVFAGVLSGMKKQRRRMI